MKADNNTNYGNEGQFSSQPPANNQGQFNSQPPANNQGQFNSQPPVNNQFGNVQNISNQGPLTSNRLQMNNPVNNQPSQINQVNQYNINLMPAVSYMQNNPIPMNLQQMGFASRLPENMYLSSSTPMEVLAISTKAVVRQHHDLMEMFTGFDMMNRYDIFLKISDTVMIKQWVAKEVSGACQRMCCDPHRRGFQIYFKDVSNNLYFDYMDFQEADGYITRPFKCYYWCCNGNTCDLNWTKPNKGPCGKVKDPVKCCMLYYEIVDENDNLKMIMIVNYCQCAVCCRTQWCGLGLQVMFPLFYCSTKEQAQEIVGSYKDKTPDGFITKTQKDFLTAMVSAADTFNIQFPVDADEYLKLLIITAALNIDYNYFQFQAKQGHHRTRGYGYGYGGGYGARMHVGHGYY